MASMTAARQTSASIVDSDLSALKIRQQAAWSSGNELHPLVRINKSGDATGGCRANTSRS